MSRLRLGDRLTVLRHGRSRLRDRVDVVVVLLALAASGGAAYTVSAGDTLSDLATRFSTSVEELADVNGIDDPDRIYVGQTLVLPGERDGQTASNEPSGVAAPPSGRTHVVRPGESLATIAATYDIPVTQLARANGIVDPNRLLAGALLRIAREAAPAPGMPTAGEAEHVVSGGETLSVIARRYGTTIGALVEANDLADPNVIVVGQRLRVPGAQSGAGWTCPVPGATFINDFGVAKPDGRHHEGVDLFAPAGTVMRAPVAGTVEQVEGQRAGLQVTLHGDDGYTYIGTHLEAFGEAGRVVAGDPLGLVGATGNARGGPPHLHFEMHYGGVVNPYPTLLDAC